MCDLFHTRSRVSSFRLQAQSNTCAMAVTFANKVPQMNQLISPLGESWPFSCSINQGASESAALQPAPRLNGATCLHSSCQWQVAIIEPARPFVRPPLRRRPTTPIIHLSPSSWRPREPPETHTRSLTCPVGIAIATRSAESLCLMPLGGCCCGGR